MAIEKEDQTTFEAMTKKDFDACRTRHKSANNKIAEERGALGSYLRDAKDNKKLHLKAFRMAMQVLNIDEPARGELLFNLGHYLKWGGALDQPDLLSDRDEDEKDVRPRHLRQAEAEREIDEAASKPRSDADEKPPVH